MLPSKVYEAIRWTIAIALPALGIFLTSISDIWELNIPAGQISLTLDAIGLFLGALFGISKLVNDSSAHSEDLDAILVQKQKQDEKSDAKDELATEVKK